MKRQGVDQWPSQTRSNIHLDTDQASSSLCRFTTPANGEGPPQWDPQLILNGATASRLEFSSSVGVPGRLVGGKEFVDDQFHSP
jgi:hypothetical protein